MNTRLALAALISCVLAAGCASTGTKPDVTSLPQRPELDEVTILATSDFHAATDRAEGLASVVRKLRGIYGDHVLHLDGGDLFQGSIEGSISKGKAIIDLYNLIGVDAAAMGNHDLDYGPEAPGRTTPNGHEDGMGNLKKRAREARFAWLSANLVKGSRKSCKPRIGVAGEHCNALGYRTILAPHAMFQRAGKKVCVIGATTPSTSAITRPEFIKGVQFLKLAPVVEAEARFLRQDESCDLVLLVSHAGLVCKSPKDSQDHINDGYCREGGDRAEIIALLKALPAGTLDAVVAGHTHMLAQEDINGTPVIEAGWRAQAVGVLHLTGSHDTTLRARFEPFTLVPDKAFEPDVTAAMAPYRKAADEQRHRAVGSTTAEFARNYSAETALGNLIADALLEAGREVDGADFAIVNAGGIRGDLPSGPINYGDVFNVVPFDNALTVVTLKGAELRRVLEIAFSGGHGISNVAGLRITRINLAPGATAPAGPNPKHPNYPDQIMRDLNGDGKYEDWERNLLVQVTDDAGHPIEDERTYKLATLDFLVSGGDHLAAAYDLVPADRKREFAGVFERDLVADFLRKHPGASPSSFYSSSQPRVTNLPPQ